MVSGSNQPLKLVEQDPDAPDASEAQWEAYEVPQLLAALREHAGLSIEDVAAALRIRSVYLRAIEDGRFDDLPGPTYAMGFVRAYADHMGLDPDAAVRRFKAERDGPSHRQELVFPVPVPEARVPGRSLIGLSVVLAMLVYGGWYYLSSQDRSVSELVEQVPANLEAMFLGKAEPTSASARAEKAEAQEAKVVVEPPAPAIQRDAVNPVVTAMLGEEASTEQDPVAKDLPSVFSTAEPVAADPALRLADPIASGVGGAIPAPFVRMPAPNAISPNEAAAATPTPFAPEASGGEGAAAEAADTQVAAVPTEPGARNYGAADGPSRIVLEATEDNWIQVRDRTSQAIFTRILQTGDRYNVPDQGGLSLTTGKAGALIVTVDGQRMKPLGPLGSVRRDVSLDAASLLREIGPAGSAGD
ncbi:MAG: helix-turn-helix domain-containing protein [Rhodospirillaceae bacterium]|jgi:cytoskeletal protein RodZ|nr:helix-turn-helix domain-containing protein [Rhodospirillaceae bacterium]MBT6119538.1 helix-turn-helix domain-containing protein [Rhodospirillaceae bacterium]